MSAPKLYSGCHSAVRAPDPAREALIVREPGRPGAVAYLNASVAATPSGKKILDQWLARGRTVEKVTLAQALEELNRYTAATDKDLPVMLRQQAD